MKQGRHHFSLAAPVIAVAALTGALAREATDVASLPVLEVWHVVPLQETVSEMAELQGQMRRRAEEKFADMRIAFYERTYADDSAFLSFIHYPDLAAESEGRSRRGSDLEWRKMFEQLVELAEDEQSYRSILLPVAGPQEAPAPKRCRIFSRSRVHPFRRAAAQRRARELVDHLNASYPELAAYAYIDDLGDPFDLYLLVDHDALWERNAHGMETSWEATRRALLEDARYEELQSHLGDVLEEPLSVIVTRAL